MRTEFEATGLSDEKALVSRVGKMAGKETKKAMPFVQGLRRQLVSGTTDPKSVFERELGFDETAVLREMMKNLKKQTGCRVVEVVAVDAGGNGGVVLVSEGGVEQGTKREGLPPTAESAVLGNPSFHFENADI